MSVQKIEISIIIPVYNAEKYIGRCIESIQKQSFSNFEVILVNDCSQDNSVEIIRKYMQGDERIKLIDKLQNEGSMLARETGYKKAQGHYVIFNDADDALIDNALQLLYNKISSTEADIVLAGCYYITDGGSKRFIPRGPVGEIDTETAQKMLLTQQLKTYLCGAIYKQKLFNTAYESFKHLTICEDRMLLIQILENSKKIIVINDPVFLYYQNMASSSQSNFNDRKLHYAMFAYDWCYNYFEQKDKFPQERRYFYIRQINYFLESGITMKRLRHASQWIDRRYNRREAVAAFGFGGALHSFMLSHCRLYCRCCHAGRILIRIIQGKN